MYCSGNLFLADTPLRNIVSSAEIPRLLKRQILNIDHLGTNLYKEFVENQLVPESKMSVCDKMKLSKFKIMSTWPKKLKLHVGESVIKLREERQILDRFMIIQKKRTLGLREALGQFEMPVIPKSLFNQDGTLLTPEN